MNNTYETRNTVRTPSQPQPGGPGITPGLIFYVLFRNKWMIAAFALFGIAAAAAVFFLFPTKYTSEAKLFVRYVQESESLNPIGSDANIKSPDRGGVSIINSEMEILGSFDLAEMVAEQIGPERILAKTGGGSESALAAGVVRKNLTLSSEKNSTVIRLVYTHPDPEIARLVLSEVIKQYLKRHVEIHRSIGIYDDFLTQQTDQLRTRLAQTEDEIRKIKERAGIISLEDVKRSLTDRRSRVQEELFNAEAELAQRQAALAAINQLSPAPVVPAETNAVVPEISSAKLAEYKFVCSRLETLLKQQLDLLSRFSAENPRVIDMAPRSSSASSVRGCCSTRTVRVSSRKGMEGEE